MHTRPVFSQTIHRLRSWCGEARDVIWTRPTHSTLRPPEIDAWHDLYWFFDESDKVSWHSRLTIMYLNNRASAPPEHVC